MVITIDTIARLSLWAMRYCKKVYTNVYNTSTCNTH